MLDHPFFDPPPPPSPPPPISKWSLRPIRTITKQTLAKIIIICDMRCVMERIFLSNHIAANVCLSLAKLFEIQNCEKRIVAFIKLSPQSKQGLNVIKIPNDCEKRRRKNYHLHWQCLKRIQRNLAHIDKIIIIADINV